MMEKKSIGSFMAALRKAHGMTQQEVADRLNVSNKTISKWERDDSHPEITLIPVIAEIFNVTADEILRGERISHEKAEENSDVTSNVRANIQTDKQLKRLLNKSITGFKNITYIALALTLIGVICLLTVSYAFYRPVLAFGILMIFIVASVLLMTIYLNNTGTIVRENDILEGKQELLKPLMRIRNIYAFVSYIANAVIFIFSLPLILIRDKVLLSSVIAIRSYLSLIPILFIISWVVYKVMNMIRERISYNNYLQSKRYLYLRMNRMNIIHAIVIIAEYIILIITKGGEAGQGSGYLSVLAIFLPVGVIVISICVNIIRSCDLFDRLTIALAGARNFLFGYVGLFLVFSIISGKIHFTVYSVSKFHIIIMWLSVIITVLCELCRINYVKKISVEQ
jgi:transcriptional regulator with XRE-family HTH domain